MAMQLKFPDSATQQLTDMVRRIAATAAAPRSLAVTGAVGGEGATTAAAALAGCLSRQHQMRVLLIDANLRQPGQHRLFGIPQSPGLSEILRDDDAWHGAIRSVGADQPSVIVAGMGLDSPERYLDVARLKEHLNRLGAEFDWVIVDCAPVNAYPDASMIAAACSASVLVVRSGRTRREIVLDAKRRLNQAGANLVGVVLNRRRYYIPEWLYRWL